MRHVQLSALESKIIRPGFDEHLKPLLAYKGQMTLGRAHRLWNLMVSAMEHEATHADITQRLAHSVDYSQLCGPENKITFMGLRSFCGRLTDNPKVLAEMPHLGEYIDWMLPRHKRPFRLERVSETTHRRRHLGAGGWRTFIDRRSKSFRLASGRGPKPKIKKPDGRIAAPLLVYPFLIHDGGRPEHALLRKVNEAVSKTLPPHMRADACQDLIVGILAGDFDPDNLTLPAAEMTKRVHKFCQNKFAEVSLDSQIPGTDGLRWIDTFSEEDSLWHRI